MDPYSTYVPGPVPLRPVDLPTYLEDELHRIASLFQGKDIKQVFAIENDVVGFIIDFPPGDWNQMFMGVDAIIDIPNGWDGATGTWTAPALGLYNVKLEIDYINIAGTGQGTLHFFAGISTGGSTSNSYTRELEAPVGTGTASVGVSRSLLLAAGDTIQFWGEAVNEGSQTQVCDVYALGQVQKVN